ncbi:hypothetical protein [Streptomyces sp. CA-251247]|uniref:hypothetical protein n=1 Tax=Streptomyces sp. CA-251247 TaxID=3240062 RepID=UPI003D9086CA
MFPPIICGACHHGRYQHTGTHLYTCTDHTLTLADRTGTATRTSSTAASGPGAAQLPGLDQEPGDDAGPLSATGAAVLAGEVYEWLAARPHCHDQRGCVGRSSRPGILVPPGEEPPHGVTLSVAAAACHLAGYTLRTGSIEATAPDGACVYVPRKAAELLGLNEMQALGLLFTPSTTTAMGRLAQLARR